MSFSFLMFLHKLFRCPGLTWPENYNDQVDEQDPSLPLSEYGWVEVVCPVCGQLWEVRIIPVPAAPMGFVSEQWRKIKRRRSDELGTDEDVAVV
jgi:hypothetical protein